MRWFLALLLALSLAPAARAGQAAQPAGPSAFTPAQRAEIIQIMRNALRTDPSILRDALMQLRADAEAQQEKHDTDAVQANRAALFFHPGDPVLGNPHGKITIVEFFDVRCPYCRRMRPAIQTLIAHNPDLRIVMKDLPILGPASVLGAQALLAAQPQGGYAAMQNALMREGVNVDTDTIKQAAEHAGLDWPKLRQAMSSSAVQQQIDENLRLAGKLGLHGTPALIFGNRVVPGALDAHDLQQMVNALRSATG